MSRYISVKSVDGWMEGRMDGPIQWYVCISSPSGERWKTLFWLLVLVHRSLTCSRWAVLGAMIGEICLSFGFQEAKKEKEEEEGVGCQHVC